MSTTMSSVLILWLVAFVVQPADVNSQTCPLAQCNDLVDRLDTFNVMANLIQQKEKQQQELQQKQQKLILEQLTQLTTLNKTVEQQQQQLQGEQIQKLLATLKETGERQEQQGKDVATLTQTVEQQTKQNLDLQEQLTKQEKTVEEYEKVIRELKKPAADCADLLKRGHFLSGVNNIIVEGKTLQVFCDQSTDNGGWLVIQRRVDNTTDFYRDWNSYKEGFGDLTRNFWLGNDKLHTITAQKNYTLRVDLEDFEGATRYAEYTYFAVANEQNKYKLSLGTYSGTAGDSLTFARGMKFTTLDRDNDNRSGNCAKRFKGALWYKSCHHANPNGLYLGGANTAFGEGINWRDWHGFRYSLKTTAMKIRPK